MDNSEKTIAQLFEDLRNPKIAQEDRRVIIGEIAVYLSQQLNGMLGQLNARLELLRV